MNILQEADKITVGDRRDSYGHPSKFFKNLAVRWSVETGFDISPQMIWRMMVQLKLERDKTRPKRDNKVDIAGYARTAEMAEDVWNILNKEIKKK